MIQSINWNKIKENVEGIGKNRDIIINFPI